MPPNNSTGGSADVREYLERALATAKGIKVRVGDAGMAKHLRQRIYSYRADDRKQSRKIYEPDMPQHGRSVYDELTVIITEENDLIISKVQANLTVEEL